MKNEFEQLSARIEKGKKLLFVYGTLRHDAANPCENYGGVYVGPARLEGAVMYDLGWFPGIKLEGSESVTGDVYEVDTSIILSLDAYEGCRPDSPETSLYTRETVSIEGYGDTLVYQYRGYPSNRPKVLDGDWLNYVKNGINES